MTENRPDPRDPRPDAIWFSTPNIAFLELVHQAGIRAVLIDVEHGLFDLRDTDSFILLAKSLGLTVHAKVLAPEMAPIQQMLDLGADSVIIPHVGDAGHAAEICAYAKFAPLGRRSCAGGRTMAYGPASTKYYADQNAATKCYPMIETAAAFRDIEAILALECVDGVFVGPTDLSLSQGRGHYLFDDTDQRHIGRIAEAARNAGKSWIMPAWSPAERALALQQEVDFMVLGHEYAIFKAGLQQTLEAAGIQGAHDKIR